MIVGVFFWGGESGGGSALDKKLNRNEIGWAHSHASWAVTSHGYDLVAGTQTL